MAISQKALEREVTLAGLVVGQYFLDDTTAVQTAQVAINISDNILFGLFFQNNLATYRSIGESTFNLIDYS